MPRSLVTGAAGFIGSHLCDRLLAHGHHVVGVDDLTTGRLSNLHAAIKHPNFTLSEARISTSPWLANGAPFDYVFHLAAKADIVPSIVDPRAYHNTNVTETASLLEACRNMKGLKKFVYAASSSCYGIPDINDFPTTERAPIRCEYPYAHTKYVGEQYVMHWAKMYKIPVLSLRLFNVYGPRSRTAGAYGAVFGVFLSQIANGKPVTIVGDGTQTRDFTFVADVTRAFQMAAESQFDRQVFNIGSGFTNSVNYVAQLLGAEEKVYIPRRPGEPGITFADITKARELLGYIPGGTIEYGCSIMRQHIEEYKSAPLWTPETIKEETKEWFNYLGAK